jgi:hypothetical protein
MHRRLLPVVALVVIAIVGCKKKPVDTSQDTVDTNNPGFVPIMMDSDEMEDLMGSELMTSTAKCGDLVSLEPNAMMGKLTDPQIRCLEEALHNAEKQTTKDKLSRVLMSDAWAKGDAHRWESIVRRHLEEIDRSDADLCYKFSKYLSERGPEYSDETMHWAEVALENRHQWTGDTHISRVNSLYKIRAVAAQDKWTYLEDKYVREPSDELAVEKDKARNQAKTLAREWLEYAKQAGKDPTTALQLCISAAGTAEFCEEAQ